MRVGAQALAGYGLAAEVVELILGQAALEERPGVDARSGVALVEDLVTCRAVGVLAPEEVVEADLVEGRRRGVRGQVAADPGEPAVRPQDHRHRVPADQPADPQLELLVAREERLLLRTDRVDVAGLGQRRQADVELARPLEQLEHEEPGAVLALAGDDLVERLEPLRGLRLVDVGELVLELVEVHRCWAAPSWRSTLAGRCGRPQRTLIGFGRTVPQPSPACGPGAWGHRPAAPARWIPCILPLDPTGRAPPEGCAARRAGRPTRRSTRDETGSWDH